MNLSKHISAYFVQQGIITAEDEPIYQFGIEQIFFQLLNFIVAVIIGLCMGQLIESLLFLITYIPLRKYAGGWHASTQIRCFWLSTVLILMALIVIGTVPFTGLILLLLLVPAASVIFILAPVADENKPLSQNEHKIYGRRARIILIFLLITAIVFYFLNLLNIVACIATAIFTLSIMLILGFIKNKGKRLVEEHLEGDV